MQLQTKGALLIDELPTEALRIQGKKTQRHLLYFFKKYIYIYTADEDNSAARVPGLLSAPPPLLGLPPVLLLLRAFTPTSSACCWCCSNCSSLAERRRSLRTSMTRTAKAPTIMALPARALRLSPLPRMIVSLSATRTSVQRLPTDLEMIHTRVSTHPPSQGKGIEKSGGTDGDDGAPDAEEDHKARVKDDASDDDNGDVHDRSQVFREGKTLPKRSIQKKKREGGRERERGALPRHGTNVI
jgi:hypothetical protein